MKKFISCLMIVGLMFAPIAGAYYTPDGYDIAGDGASVVIEGTTVDDNETTLAYTDPTADRTVTTPDETGTVVLAPNAAQSTSDLGWAVVAGANTVCNTTCTSACIFGVNTASATADIVDCVDATADECLCAGAS